MIEDGNIKVSPAQQVIGVTTADKPTFIGRQQFRQTSIRDQLFGFEFQFGISRHSFLLDYQLERNSLGRNSPRNLPLKILNVSLLASNLSIDTETRLVK